MQSSSQIIITNKPISSFYRPDALPVAQPTVSKHWRENITFHGLAYLKLILGSSNFVFRPLIAPGYLGERCHASHQPSDASTPSLQIDYHYCEFVIQNIYNTVSNAANKCIIFILSVSENCFNYFPHLQSWARVAYCARLHLYFCMMRSVVHFNKGLNCGHHIW